LEAFPNFFGEHFGIGLATVAGGHKAGIGQTGSGGLPLPKKVLISLSIRLMCL
jgi:hypothetical protein